jgi:hypothetical protein
LVEVEALSLVHVLQMTGAGLQLPYVLDVEPLVVDHHLLGLFALAFFFAFVLVHAFAFAFVFGSVASYQIKAQTGHYASPQYA